MICNEIQMKNVLWICSLLLACERNGLYAIGNCLCFYGFPKCKNKVNIVCVTDQSKE